MFKQTSGKQGLGWFSAGMLCLLLSSPAWGLDLDHEIAQAEADSAQILSTLGRHKKAASATSTKSSREVQVKMIAKPKAGKRR